MAGSAYASATVKVVDTWSERRGCPRCVVGPRRQRESLRGKSENAGVSRWASATTLARFL